MHFRPIGDSKDYIEKIDFQELIFAIGNWPCSDLFGAFVSIMHYLDQSATSLLNHVFLAAVC